MLVEIVCVHPDCAGHDTATQAVLHSLHHLDRRFARLEQAIAQEGTRIVAQLADLEAKFDALRTDVTRALADLKNAVDRLNSGDLPPASQAVVDDIAAKLDDLDAAVNSADPAAPAEPPADQGGANQT